MIEFLIATATIVGQVNVTHDYIQTDYLTTTGEIVTITQFDETLSLQSKEMGGCWTSWQGGTLPVEMPSKSCIVRTWKTKQTTWQPKSSHWHHPNNRQSGMTLWVKCVPMLMIQMPTSIWHTIGCVRCSTFHPLLITSLHGIHSMKLGNLATIAMIWTPSKSFDYYER